MKHAIIGSKDYPHWDDVQELIESLDPDTVVVTTLERGVDAYVNNFAEQKGLTVEIIPLQWDEYGKRAKKVRDRELAHNCDCLSAFMDSSGKRSAIWQARDLGKHVEVKLCH